VYCLTIWGERDYAPSDVSETKSKIAKVLAAVARGVELSRGEEAHATVMGDAIRLAFDTVPETRRELLLAAIRGTGPSNRPTMAEDVMRETLEDLRALGLVEPCALNSDSPRNCVLTERANSLLRTAGVIAFRDPSGMWSLE